MDLKDPKHVDPIGENVQLDEAVLSKLPNGCKVTSVMLHGRSLWVATVKITAQLEDGSTEFYFKKAASTPGVAALMEGAFEAEQALHSIIPTNVPKPIAWGPYKDDPDTYFYLSEFVDMVPDDVPTARDWASTVSSLHLGSMGKSPTGQFGFHVNTHLANVPVNNTWSPSWESFWSQQIKSLFDRDDMIHGEDEELRQLKTAYLEKVIPRYLRPLEEEGRSVTPCLVHSDLWPGNIKPMVSSDDLCIFDACAYWGHNEADLGICRNPRYKLGKPFIMEYMRHVPVSEPAVDFDGRNAVYAIKYHTLLSILYVKDKRFREVLVEELKIVTAMVNEEDHEEDHDSKIGRPHL